MAKLTNYAIIDHIGSMTNTELTNTYNEAYLMAGALGYNKTNCFTMKKVCQLSSPNAQAITDKQKIWVRTNKHPKIVILVCPEMYDAVKNAESLWRKNDVYVHLVIANQPEYDFGLDYHNISIYRHCAMIWGNAIGWEFSAPLMRETNIRVADINYIPRFDRKKLLARGMSTNDLTKITSDPEKYLDEKHSIASEDECKAFFQHYRWLYENNLLAESLEPDYELCPSCGRPIRINVTHNTICDYCDTEVSSEEVVAFYDDSFNVTDSSGNMLICKKGAKETFDWFE